MKDEPINVIAFCGDGGGVDMGLSAISAALQHDEYNLLILCYDNESYANTDIQVSGSSPWGANSTFSPPGKAHRIINNRWKKNTTPQLRPRAVPGRVPAAAARRRYLRGKRGEGRVRGGWIGCAGTRSPTADSSGDVLGVTMRLDPINLYDYEARAKQVLPHNNWEFIEAGSMDEITTRRNRSAYEEIALRPRFLRDISERNLATTVLGTEISFPVMISPAGGHMNAHPEGELATARGAGRSNTLMMLSTSSNYSMEEVSEVATGPLWFQLYHRGYDLTEMLVHRAEEAGYKAICLTVDTPAPSPKERDVRNRYSRPADLGNFLGMENRLGEVSGTDESPQWRMPSSPPLTWQELDWLRGLTSLPLVLKGIRTGEDAHIAVESGVNGILVSTHGGRQLDMTLGSIEMVPEVVEAAKGQAEVYVDSGVRRGSDVLKALALGARAVAIGRPLYWGLAVDGADGVHGVLELMREELDRVMAYCGQTSVQDLEPSLISVPRGWGERKTYP